MAGDIAGAVFRLFPRHNLVDHFFGQEIYRQDEGSAF
jgi:hypothetical protein